jgi:hypothetical protein
LGALASSDLQAQVDKAIFSGTVVDASNAVIVGANIELKNVATGGVYKSMTDGRGHYLIPEVPIGTYDVTASKSGFQKVLHSGVVAAVAAHPVVDFTLQVGGTSEVVEVKSQVTQVQTENTAVGMLITPQQMDNLPLNGRNFTDLLALAPGVTEITALSSWSPSQGRYGYQNNYAVSGSRPVGQAYMLDDTDVRDAQDHGTGAGVAGTSLGMDAIQEFSIMTNTYSAEFGGTGTAINAVTKSGTNDLHGSVYEYLRNTVFNADNWFAVKGAPKLPFHQNQFGASLGGPIKKNKAFFFINYEGLRNRQSFPEFAEVPDLTGTAASNPNYFWNNTGGITPAGTTPTTEILNPSALAILALYPASNQSRCNESTAAGAGLAWFCDSAGQLVSEDLLTGRVDYTLSQKDSIFARYQRDFAYRVNPGTTPAFTDLSPTEGWSELDHAHNQTFTLEERHTFSPRTLNSVRVTFNRTFENNLAGGVGSSVLNFLPNRGGNGIVSPGGALSAIGGSDEDPYATVQNKPGFGDDLSLMLGKHNLRIGGNFTRIQTNTLSGWWNAGWWIGYDIEGFLDNYNGVYLGSAGPGYTYQGVPWTDARYWRQIQFAPYIQDDWKVTRRLTLNLGVRYEWASNPRTVGAPIFVLNNPATDTSFEKASDEFLANPNVKSVDPRIGLAWDPFGDHKTSIRAAFGMFHEPVTWRSFEYSFDPMDPAYEQINGYVASPPFPPGQQFGQAPLSGNPTYFQTINDDVHTAPYQMQFNLTIQRQLPKGILASVGYNGSAGVHLFQQEEINLPVYWSEATAAQKAYTPNAYTASAAQQFTGIATGVGAPGTPTNPFIGVRENTNFGPLESLEPASHSSYNSLQASLARQFSSGLTFNTSYTFSKCMDNGSGSTGLEQLQYGITDPYNPGLDRGLCSFNVPSAFRLNGVYRLPFKGSSLGSVGTHLISGWQFSPIFQANSGMPFTVTNGFNPASSQGDFAGGMENERPVAIPGCKVVIGKESDFFNPDCFVLAPYGSLSTLGRNQYPGPGYYSLDFALMKETKLTERVNMQFRFEMFNALNHPNFTLLGGSESAFTGNPVAPGGMQLNFLSPTFWSYEANAGGYNMANLSNPASYDPGGAFCSTYNYGFFGGLFGPPTVTSKTGGTCHNTANGLYWANPARQIQFSLRFTF